MKAEKSQSPSGDLKLGIVFILLAWLAFSVMAAVSRYATSSASLPTVILFQNFFSWLVIAPWSLSFGLRTLKTKRIGLIMVRSVVGLIGFSFLFMAVQKTSLVDAVLLNNASPLLVPFGVWLWLKIPINHKLWPGIIFGFIGIIFILKPGKDILDLGAFYALISAVCLCIVMISLRLLSYTEKHHAILFYYFLIASIIMMPLGIYYWRPIGAEEWGLLISLGLLSAIGQLAFTKAFHYAKPSILGPFCYMAVVYSGLIEWVLWGKVPDGYSWMGILLVCLGGIWTIRYSKPPSPPPPENA